MATAPDIVFAVVPLTFDRPSALRFTGLSEKLFASLERAGSLSGRKIGRHGQVVYLREQLEVVTARLFGAGATDIDDEFADIIERG